MDKNIFPLILNVVLATVRFLAHLFLTKLSHGTLNQFLSRSFLYCLGYFRLFHFYAKTVLLKLDCARNRKQQYKAKIRE